MVIRRRADTAIAIIGLGRLFPDAPGLQAHALALEAAGQALADAGFPGGRGLSHDRAGVIIATTLAQPGSGPVRQAAERLGSKWPTGVPAGAGRPVPPILTAETMPAAANRGGGAGTIAGQVCARFGLHGAGHTVDGSRFSALLAVAAACSALAAGDLDFVLAGGVDTGPDPVDPAGPDGAGGPDGPGEVRAGDAAGDRGLARDVPAHGCGMVALMRAGDAAAAGAPLYAEITGWGMCADTGDGAASGAASGRAAHAGRVRTLPSLRRACRQAGIDPEAERLIIDVGRPRAAGAIAGVLKAAAAVASRSKLTEVSARGLGGGAVNLLLSAPGEAAAPGEPGRPAASSVAVAGEAPGLPVHAFSGGDPGALAAGLNRIAEVAPRLSSRERPELACQLRRQPPGGPIRAAFTADADDPVHSLRDEAAVPVLRGAPCGNGQNQRDQGERRSEDTGRFSGNCGKHPGGQGSGDRTLDRQGTSAIPETAPVPRRLWTVTVQQPIRSERGMTASMPDAPGTAGPPDRAGWPAVRGRFLESVLVHYPGSELVAEARLSPATDPYLTDYRVDGVTELPAVLGLEAMAQVASALAGRPLSRAATITLGSPVVVRQDRPAVIRLCARNQGDAVEAVLRSAETGYRSDHIRAVFPLGPLPREETGLPYTAARSGDGPEHLLDGMTAGIVDGTELYGPLRFPAGRFRRVAFLPALTSRNCRALLRGTDDQPWFGPGLGPLAAAPLLLGSPGVNDAAMHVLRACVPHRKLVPAGCESLSCSGTVVRGAVEVRAAERSAGGGEYVWDVQAVDTDGRPVASWAGLRLRDAGPLPRVGPWSPMLLAVYLERGVTALGLDPDLRVTVRAGHPRQAAGIPVRSGSEGTPGSTGKAAGEAAGATGAAVPREGERREAVAGIYAIAAGPAASGGQVAGSGPQLGSVLYPAAGAGGRARRSHLDGLTLMVDGAFPAACEWEAADGGRNADGGGEWAEELGPGFGALRTELLERCGEPAALVDARLWTATQCLSKAGRGGQRPLVAETGAGPGPGDGPDGRWVLLRTGDAAIASTVVEVADVGAPVAVAIMARAAS